MGIVFLVSDRVVLRTVAEYCLHCFLRLDLNLSYCNLYLHWQYRSYYFLCSCDHSECYQPFTLICAFISLLQWQDTYYTTKEVIKQYFWSLMVLWWQAEITQKEALTSNETEAPALPNAGGKKKKKSLESRNNCNLSHMPAFGKHFKPCCVALNPINKLVIKSRSYCVKKG